MKRYDAMMRRRATRSGRERGVWIFIPAEELVKAGVDPAGEPPWYRTWGSRKRAVLVQLYREA